MKGETLQEKNGVSEQPPAGVPTPQKEDKQQPKQVSSWPMFIFQDKASDAEIVSRAKQELLETVKKFEKSLKPYNVLYLYDIHFEIEPSTSDQIYTALLKQTKKDKDILLLALSPGGSIEPAYQLSKICAEFSKNKFNVIVPRAAKSAATLVALGATEIHMGSLSELGPIDPQIAGRPCLGYSFSIERIAQICEKYPKSAEMFARYLDKNVWLPNVGHYERLGESAVQYAERLISNKPHLKEQANAIARKLVYEYKDHGFVIDANEATDILGKEVIKIDTSELQFSEELHKRLDEINTWLQFKNKTLRIVGDLDDIQLLEKPKKENK